MIITPPATEPLTVDLVLAHVRIDGEDDLALVGHYISAARDYAEKYLARALITQTVEDIFDCWPCNFKLEPFQSVVQITYVDGDGDTQTLESDQYITVPERGLIEPSYGVTWPTLRAQSGAVRVQTIVGFGDSWNDIPAAIQSGMLLLIGHWYANRETVTVGGSSAEVPFCTAALFNTYRRYPI